MKRDGLIIAGGVIAILRGLLGVFVWLANLGFMSAAENLIPGISLLLNFELVLALAILAIGIFAIVRSNAPASAGVIRNAGIVIIVAGVVDAVWAIALSGADSTSLPSAFGSILALALIGALLIAGAGRLSRAQSGPPPAAPQPDGLTPG